MRDVSSDVVLEAADAISSVVLLLSSADRVVLGSEVVDPLSVVMSVLPSPADVSDDTAPSVPTDEGMTGMIVSVEDGPVSEMMVVLPLESVVVRTEDAASEVMTLDSVVDTGVSTRVLDEAEVTSVADDAPLAPVSVVREPSETEEAVVSLVVT